MYSLDEVRNVDPEIAEAIVAEQNRQNDHIELIASENWVSKAVMAAMGSPLTNKYAEGYPGKRYYGGCECVDVVENLARERAKELFGCEINADNEVLKYQLLTGIVGTLREANNNAKSKALFLVLVFTDGIKKEDEKAVENNNKDFADFCKYIGLSVNGGTIQVANVALTIKKVEISLKQTNL